MKRIAFLLLAALSTAQARPLDTIKASGTLKIATEAAYKPFTYYQGSTLTGFEFELAEALAKKLGLKTKWENKPFDSLLIGLGQDRYDLVIASHGITPERLKAVDFSNPHYCSGGLLVTTKGGPQKAADLKGKTVAVQVGTTYVKAAEGISGIKSVKTYPQNTDAIQAVMNRRVDGFVTDRFVALEALKVNKALQQGELLFQEKMGIAVKKGNQELLEALNGALKAIQKDGTYAKISKKYFGQDIRCK